MKQQRESGSEEYNVAPKRAKRTSKVTKKAEQASPTLDGTPEIANNASKGVENTPKKPKMCSNKALQVLKEAETALNTHSDAESHQLVAKTMATPEKHGRTTSRDPEKDSKENTNKNTKNTTKIPKNITKSAENLNKYHKNATKDLENVSKESENIRKEALNVTKILEDTTKVPNNLTKIPKNTAQVPENITKILKNITKIPENISKTPENTNKTPENITKTPEPTTKCPGATGLASMTPVADRLPAPEPFACVACPFAAASFLELKQG